MLSALVASSLPYKLLVGLNVGQEQARILVGACYRLSFFAVVSIVAHMSSRTYSLALRDAGVNILDEKATNANGKKVFDGAVARLKGKA